MYIATVPNRKSAPAILLRESYREGTKVKTRTLLNLTDWMPERIEALRRLLRGEYDLHPDGYEVHSGPVVGTLYVLREILKGVGIEKALGKSLSAKLCAFMICARVAAQGSRLSSVRWAKNNAVKEILGINEQFNEDDLYRALDWLAEEQERIEDALYKEYVKKNGKAPVLVLYDVTSSYFEGQLNELSRYGYNRDGKRGKKQIIIGLLADPEGEPLAVRVFHGNVSDPRTINAAIEAIKTRFQIKDVVFVGDRGMIKSAGKASLIESGFHYITALTDPQVFKLLKEKKIQLEMFDEEVHEVALGGVRYVLRRNNLVRNKEERRRQDKLSKLQKLIEQKNEYLKTHTRAKAQTAIKELSIWAKKHKISSFVELSIKNNALVLSINDEARLKDSLLDGCYVLETDLVSSLSATQVHSSYLNLQKVERDFRTMKTGLLEVRPIFLRKGNRTQAHVFIAMLALKISRYMETKIKLLWEDFPNYSIRDAVDALSRLCFMHFRSGSTSVTRLPALDEIQSRIFAAFNLKFPREIM